jgi:hypothetical protein
MINQNISVQGEFSLNVYDKYGNLKDSKKNIKNFITSTGLFYPSLYSFADCFRFISLGSGNIQNTITGIYGGTTGLQQPLQNFSYIGSRNSYGDVTTSNYENPSCGFRENASGVSLFRGWKIPSGSGTFDSNYTFKEIMLSPGKPTGSSLQCGCQGGQVQGVDASIIADYYDENNPSICDAFYAFTRITGSIPVTNSDYLVVNYQLNLNYNTGAQKFVINIQKALNTPGVSSNWSGLITGLSSITNHGIKLINDGTSASSSSSRTQISSLYGGYMFSQEYGESFIPLFGCPLEPSNRPLNATVNQINLSGYLSTDNQQFLVNNFSGGPIDTGIWQPFNISGFPRSSGVLTFINNPSQQGSSQFVNIRTSLAGAIFPSNTNFTMVGSNPLDLSFFGNNTLQKTALDFSSPYFISGRSKRAIFRNRFGGLSASQVGFTGLAVRSLIFAYVDANGTSTYPFYDVIFNGIDGSGLAATGNFGGNPLAIQQSSSTDYFFMEGGADLSFGMNLTWCSPCSPDVIGCT